MIGLAAVKAVVAPHIETIRLVAFVLTVLAVMAALWTVAGWRRDSLALDAAQAQLRAEQQCAEGSRCAARLTRQQADGLVAVEKARQTAVERLGRELAAERVKGRAEAERLMGAERAAKADALAWRSRFESAVGSDARCQAWSQEVVPCPVQ